MSPIPADWEEAHTPTRISECIPLFRATDFGHYFKMNSAYCDDKINTGCMWLWRHKGIDWTNTQAARQEGLALGFPLWRPRYSTSEPVEKRYCVCLFIGSSVTPADVVDSVTIAAREFADEKGARDYFYIVKDVSHAYPPKVEEVFNAVRRRLLPANDAPAEHGWRRRAVWKVVDWT